MHRMLCLLGTGIVACAPADAAGMQAERDAVHQHAQVANEHAHLLTEQLERVRRATAQYQSVEQAQADGFVRFGRHEGALMGEHWFRRDLIDNPLDLERPSTLQYATIDGRRVLVGVAYSVYQRPGIPMPDGFAGSSDVWHVHDVSKIFGAITEGRPLLGRIAERAQQRAGSPTSQGRTQLVMLHAWVWLDNPDGVFALHHRALPYLRAGLPADWGDDADHDAAFGVALLDPGTCRAELRTTNLLGHLSRMQRLQLASRCAAASATVRSALQRASTARALNAVAQREWRSYLHLRDTLLDPRQRARLASVIEH